MPPVDRMTAWSVLKDGCKDLKALCLRWEGALKGSPGRWSVLHTFWPHVRACAGAAVREYFCLCAAAVTTRMTLHSVLPWLRVAA
jgi:hypothetical protein